MSNLGHTWYPKDWWNSKTYYRLKKHGVVIRYAYREILDYLYMEGGESPLDKDEIEDRFDIKFTGSEYDILKKEFIIEDGIWTHESINSRLRKAVAARKNGSLGGRPRKDNEAVNEAVVSSNEAVIFDNEAIVGQHERPMNVEGKPKKPTEITQKNPPYKLNKSKLNKNESECVHTHDEIMMFEKFQKWVKENTPTLNRMNSPLTIAEYLKLKQKFTPAVLTDVMFAMENKPTLVKNYKSTYRTINTWCKMRTEPQQSNSSPLTIDNLKIE